MDDRATRELAMIEAAWSDLQVACERLSDEDLTIPGVTADWSVKDILAHITTWEEATMRLSQAQLAGTTPAGWDDEQWDLDTFNARASAEKARLSPGEVRAQLAATHEELLTWIPTIPAAQLAPGSDVEDRLRGDTWDHYPEHAEAIRAWRERRGT